MAQGAGHRAQGLRKGAQGQSFNPEPWAMNLGPSLNNNAQSILETTVLIVVIVATLITMQVYLKRGIQGRLRSNVDSVGEQYDPNTTESDFTLGHRSHTTTITNVQAREVEIDLGGQIGNDILSITTSSIETHYDNATKRGWENVLK